MWPSHFLLAGPQDLVSRVFRSLFIWQTLCSTCFGLSLVQKGVEDERKCRPRALLWGGGRRTLEGQREDRYPWSPCRVSGILRTSSHMLPPRPHIRAMWFPPQPQPAVVGVDGCCPLCMLSFSIFYTRCSQGQLLSNSNVPSSRRPSRTH